MTDTSLSNWLIIAPARMESQRLPNKPLADLAGKPMIVRVVENLAPLADKGAAIIVATDDARVAVVCTHAGITARMTRKDHLSGTDRCAEVAATCSAPFVLNVQGDEPFVGTDDLCGLMRAMEASEFARMGTMFYKNTNREMASSPNIVKTLINAKGYAIHFSRLPLPYVRDDVAGHHLPPYFLQHIGVYAFRRQDMLDFVNLPASMLEQMEKLEQLRAIEHGWPVLLHAASSASRGIDTTEDLEAARASF